MNPEVLTYISSFKHFLKSNMDARKFFLVDINEELFFDKFSEIAEKNYSFSAGQYFDVKIDYVDITPKEFESKMKTFQSNLDTMFAESKELEKEIQKQLKGLKYEI